MSKIFIYTTLLLTSFRLLNAAELNIKKDSKNEISNIIIFYGDIKEGVQREIERYLKPQESYVDTIDKSNSESNNFAFTRIKWTELVPQKNGQFKKIIYTADIHSTPDLKRGKIILKSKGEYKINFDKTGRLRKSVMRRAV